MKAAWITGGAVVLAALIPLALNACSAAEPGSGGSPGTARVSAPPTTTAGPRKLDIELPNGGNIPVGNITVKIPNADPAADEYVWVGVRHVKDLTWYLYPCGEQRGDEAVCLDLPVGAGATAPGPWTITGFVVDEAGRKQIIDNKQKYTGDLSALFGSSLVAYGASPAQRTGI